MAKIKPIYRDAFGVSHADPGWIYIIRSHRLLKIGKTTNWERRKRDAKTWLPDMRVLAVKPFWNVSLLEKSIQIGLTDFWYAGEWYDFRGDSFEETFIETFSEFYDDDRTKNSIDFIYWFNGSGMNEFTIEQSLRKMTKKKWLEKEGSSGRRG